MSGHVYRGVVIWPRNLFGMYSAFVNGRQVAADTVAGIKVLIRAHLDGAL